MLGLSFCWFVRVYIVVTSNDYFIRYRGQLIDESGKLSEKVRALYLALLSQMEAIYDDDVNAGLNG